MATPSEGARGRAHLLLGDFLLQRLKLPVLLLGDQDPPTLDVRHGLQQNRPRFPVSTLRKCPEFSLDSLTLAPYLLAMGP